MQGCDGEPDICAIKASAKPGLGMFIACAFPSCAPSSPHWEPIMTKEKQHQNKNNKKAPAMNLKEKRAAKEAKRNAR
jgi:hypothetical protein